MEAVSRGASEAGGHVIGVTCVDIENWRKVGANRWVKEEWRKQTLIERLQALVEGCDAALALPGGPGTLTEVSLMWNISGWVWRFRSAKRILNTTRIILNCHWTGMKLRRCT